VKVRGLQVHGAPVGTVDAGHRVAVNLGGVDVADIRRGDTLTVPGAFEITRRFDVRLDLLADAPPLKHGSRVRFHHGTAEILGRVALASEGFGRIRLESPAVLTRGDRFILRAYSPPVTIGGGVVLDPAPARGAIRTAAGATRFERLDASTREAARVFLDERAASGLSIGGLAARAGVPLEEAGAIADALGEAHEAVAVGDTLVSAAIVADLEKRLIALVAAHHEREPLSEGLPREEARERLFARAADGVFERVLADLAAANRLAVRDQLAIPGRGVSLSPEEAAAHERLARAYRDAGLAPPDVAAVAASVHVDARIADRVIKVLVRQKRLIRLDTLLFDADALARLKEEVAGWKAGGAQARVDVATFKDRYGLSRKYAIPLLEWLDRERVTRRIGDGRVVL
jgi:selenocysteine-specific elongation factor